MPRGRAAATTPTPTEADGRRATLAGFVLIRRANAWARPLRLPVPLDPHARDGAPLVLGGLDGSERTLRRQPVRRGVEVGKPRVGWSWARIEGSTRELSTTRPGRIRGP